MSFTPEHPEFQVDSLEMEGPSQEMLQELLDFVVTFARYNYKQTISGLGEISVFAQLAKADDPETVYDFHHFPDGTEKSPNLIGTIGIVDWPMGKSPRQANTFSILRIPDGLAIESFTQMIQRTEMHISKNFQDEFMEKIKPNVEELETIHDEENRQGLNSVNKKDVQRLLEVLPYLQHWQRPKSQGE